MAVVRQSLLDPTGLMEALQGLFPHFVEAELDEEVSIGAATIHTIWMRFSGEFNAEKATDAQLRHVAELVCECIRKPDALENAVSTCFLEHLSQIDKTRKLWPFLPAAVKAHIQKL